MKISLKIKNLINHFIDNCNIYINIIQWFDSFFQFDHQFVNEKLLIYISLNWEIWIILFKIMRWI